MMLTIEEKIEIARYRMEKAKRLLRDADTLFQSSSFESSINRTYYAVLNASRSLFILRGIEAETHEGIKTMLSKEFIKTGLLPKYGEVRYYQRRTGREIDFLLPDLKAGLEVKRTETGNDHRQLTALCRPIGLERC